MPVNTKAHTDNHAEEFQRLMHNHDYAMTLALQFRERRNRMWPAHTTTQLSTIKH